MFEVYWIQEAGHLNPDDIPHLIFQKYI